MDSWPTISGDPEVQSRYKFMRESGESHNMAEMLATRTFPGARTDREWNSGRCNGNQFESCPGLGDYYKGVAEGLGQSTTGKVYCPGLALFPGDPQAWVEGRGDVLRVAKERGLRVSGMVEYDPGVDAPDVDIPVDNDLVDSEVKDRCEKTGERYDEIYDSTYRLRAGLDDPNPQLVRGNNPDDHLVDFS